MTDNAEREVPTVWVLHLHHRHGDDYSAHVTEESARMALGAYVAEWWSVDGPAEEAPDDRDKAIRTYFEDNEEWYGLEKVQVHEETDFDRYNWAIVQHNEDL